MPKKVCIVTLHTNQSLSWYKDEYVLKYSKKFPILYIIKVEVYIKENRSRKNCVCIRLIIHKNT